MTFRLVGTVFLLLGVTQVVLFFLTGASRHRFGTLLCILIGVYGIYLILHSFSPSLYSLEYHFQDHDFSVTRTGRHPRTKTYRYTDITGLDLVIPENEQIYSLIHITLGKIDYLIPFSYKKKVCDQIYQFLNERMTEEQLKEDLT